MKTYPGTMGKMLGLLIVCHDCRWVQSIPPVSGTYSFWCRGHLFKQSYPYHFFITHLWAKTLSFITWALYIDKMYIFIKILKLLLPIYIYIFLIWSHLRPVYVLDINPFSVVSFANFFSHCVGCLSFLSMASFVVQKLLSLIRFHFYFSFISFALGDWSKKILLQFMSKNVLPMFSSRNFLWYHVLYLGL